MATTRQKRAIEKVVENRGRSISQAMRDAGYPAVTAKNPKNLTESKAWAELMKEYLPDENIAEKHKELLTSTRIDHMVFPLGPVGEDDKNFSGSKPNKKNKIEQYVERTTLTDKEIINMLAETGCKVRRIVHGETARHVYFWVADNKARKDAIDMAYKLKGSYAPEKSIVATIQISDTKRNKTNELISGILGNKKNT